MREAYIQRDGAELRAETVYEGYTSVAVSQQELIVVAQEENWREGCRMGGREGRTVFNSFVVGLRVRTMVKER